MFPGPPSSDNSSNDSKTDKTAEAEQTKKNGSNQKNKRDSRTSSGEDLVDTAKDLTENEPEQHIKEMFENKRGEDEKEEKKAAVMQAKNENSNGPANLK